MPTYVFYADEQNKRRSDGCNTVVAQGADIGAARSAAEALIGEPGALANFKAMDISAPAPAFVVQGHPPVGSRAQTTWLSLGRGGDPLKGA